MFLKMKNVSTSEVRVFKYLKPNFKLNFTNRNYDVIIKFDVYNSINIF